MSKRLHDALSAMKKNGMLAGFVFDEAHCVSQGVYDFRPAYKSLRWLKNSYASVSSMDLAGTATYEVKENIKQLLVLHNPRVFEACCSRPNLKYSVVQKTTTAGRIVIDMVREKYPTSSCIVYCFSKDDCGKCCSYLRSDGIEAVLYHAAMSVGSRRRALTR